MSIQTDQRSLSAGPNTVDSMNGMTGDPTQSAEVFGSSSAGSFMRQVQAAMNVKQGAPAVSAQGSVARMTKHSAEDVPLSDAEEAELAILPPKELADSLIQAYWQFEWPLYPIIDRRNITAVYESLWTVPRPGFSLTSMSIINLCFALGSQYCALLPPQQLSSLSQDFFSRGEQLFQRSQYTPSLDKVQCLLLFGIYLQSTNHVLRCWMTVGEAIRMAQSLGLYLDQHAPCDTVGYREYTRRTWHGCVWLDRVLSATLGRPGMIPKWLFNSIPFPSMIDDEFFETQPEGSEKRPDGKPCILAFAGKAFELYQILDDILLEIYLTPNKEAGLETKLPNVLEIDRRIHSWRQSLPNYLKFDSAANDDGSIMHRQATVLRIRSLHIRILLFRPVLISYCKRSNPVSTEGLLDSTDSSLTEVMLSQCSRMCFQLAHELIGIFNNKLDPKAPNLSPLPSWWYSVLYVFTAATVILTERFLEGRDNGSKKATTSRTWDAAMHILESYSVIADSAKRCKAALEVLSESLSLGKTDNIWLWESFTEMYRLLGESSGVPSFDSDDFLWLG
ncbi:fungal specific transcription factor domain-containing protein [Aspergillus melleus]|nr:uncharacterized protein LDX57_005058 [Aspergillus melleus]KAH8427345.1 hypothetical protein LDX57_005058 [Aspergillus melleus]